MSRLRQCSGGDEGNRTLACRLKAECSAFELHPHDVFTFWARRIALFGLRCDPALRFMANTTKGFRVARGFGFRFIEFPEVVEEIGARGARRWSRTIDARLFKPSLYRLSYPCKIGSRGWIRTSDFELMRLARTAGLLYSANLVVNLVGVRRFELRATASQTQCSDQAELHTENW